MKKSVKGALLSGLIYPGLGQLWLKRYGRGIALIAAVSAALAVVVAKAVRQAYEILHGIESGGGTVDLVAVVHGARNASSAANDVTTLAATIVLVFCWVVGVVDAYLAGEKLDQAGPETGSGEQRMRVGAKEERP